MDAIAAHEQEIIAYALERLEEIPGVSVFGPAAEHKGGVASFTLDGRAPARYLADPGYLWRGYPRRASLRHAAAREIQPAGHRRASFYLYNHWKKWTGWLRRSIKSKSFSEAEPWMTCTAN